VTVAPARLERWLAGFAERHGPTTTRYDDTTVVVTAADASVATVEVPFPPLHGELVPHVLQERTVGVLLVRLGGHAAGVFVGDRLTASKVGSRQVHGRSAAGGWSQQRFARRRENQSAQALSAAADVAAGVLLGRPLDALVVGGERSAVETVLADRRLEGLRALRTGRLLDVPDPRLKVLQQARFRDVWIRVEQ
jgi:Actinobacteria/chloroflexi VLRF1 release factor